MHITYTATLTNIQESLSVFSAAKKDKYQQLEQLKSTVQFEKGVDALKNTTEKSQIILQNLQQGSSCITACLSENHEWNCYCFEGF